MRRFWSGAVLGCILLVLTVGVALGQSFPSPRGYVTDEAQVLSPETVARLESRLAALEKDTTAQVAVAIVLTLDGYSVEEYAAAMFQKWGIGQKGKDNGVLFLVAFIESRVRIEVGYGLEPIITDGRAGRILDRDVVPYLRDDDFNRGITAGVAAIEEYIRSGAPPSPLEENPVQGMFAGFHLPMPLVVALGILTIYMLGFMARTRSIWAGGIWGLMLGVVLGLGWGRLWAVILLPAGLAVVGTFLDLLLSANYRGRATSGLPTGWMTSWGGFSSGGGSRFGGFGGGRSGGGGASRGF
jgi:uncharacterized protein